ncbi:unnamed protein product [Phyllotreta striolata]|uniref:Uncharacterized protein n=1 Tax=Phyllotreta striolata TaxID=444603 RepID=A0A9N9XLS9_PHYSR|nr:unnamed protein product [Phyllotreta striolata]
MIILRVAILIAIIYYSCSSPSDYKSLIENIKIDYYNTDLASPNSSFKLFKYNRSQFAINVSIWILQDLDGRKIESATKLYKFLSNDFKYTGVQLKVPNVCKMWKDDLYGIRTIMRKCGDVDLCDIKKGHWHLDNCWPTDSIKYFPKSIPLGHYKIAMESKLMDGTPLVTIAWYGEASLYFRQMKNNREHL